MPAVAMAMSVIASADREIAVRHLDRTRYRIAEISVPEWAIPIQNTKLPMYSAQPTGMRDACHAHAGPYLVDPGSQQAGHAEGQQRPWPPCRSARAAAAP